MSPRPFVVLVTGILRGREPRRERRVGRIDDLFVSGSAVPLGGEVTVDVVLVPLGPSIEAVGRVTAPWEGECRRCLRLVRSEARAEVRELFEEEPVEEETYPLSLGEIDLESLAREAIMLELPQAPLCREDCRGLCPVCGADLNEVACSCGPVIDPRWGALDQLRTDE